MIEVMVSIAILGLWMGAILDGQVLCISMANDAKFITVATFLARGQMLEVEDKIKQDGMGEFESKETCEFGKGFEAFKCEYTLTKVQLPLGDIINRFLSSAMDVGKEGSSAPVTPKPQAQQMSMLQGYTTQLQNLLERAMREIRVTVSWRRGKKWDNVELVTHYIEIQRAGASLQDFLSGKYDAMGIQDLTGKGGTTGTGGTSGKTAGTGNPLPPGGRIPGVAIPFGVRK